VFENSLPRQAATFLLSRLSPAAFVGPLSPLQMREVEEPRLPDDDWLALRTRLCPKNPASHVRVSETPGVTP